MSEIQPVEINAVDASTIQIDWSDGEQRVYNLVKLQQQCPCAGCREKHGKSQQAENKRANMFTVLRPEETQPLQLLEMAPVGNYAYSLTFSHGCSRGIWTFENLRQLGEPVQVT